MSTHHESFTHADDELFATPANRAFPLTCFAERRQRLIDALRAEGGGVVVLASAPVAMRSRDSDYSYRQDSDFFYLTGFTEPDALLVIDVRTNVGTDIGTEVQSQVQSEARTETRQGDGADKRPTARPVTQLFCRTKDPEREVWEGFHYGPEAARDAFGLDASWPNSERDVQLPTLLDGANAVYFPLYAPSGATIDADIARWIGGLRARRGTRAPATLRDIRPIVEAMRVVKDSEELARMRRAARISAHAHRRAMQVSRPGLAEYALEAELLHTFRRYGAQAPAYGSIVAAGANACVLHYPAGDKVLQDGELVLIDAACELDGYASDITRTFPANGHFTGPQRALYDIVVAANHAAAAATRAGARFDDGHMAALRVLAEGMLDTQLLKRDDHGSVDDVIADKAYSRFYMHRTGHWLGLDVHDCGDYFDRDKPSQSKAPAATTPQTPSRSRTLMAGMVLTIEPGLYVRRGDDVPPDFWDIGIRVEDDAVVTEAGCELITRDIPVDADEIEAIMRDAQ